MNSSFKTENIDVQNIVQNIDNTMNMEYNIFKGV